MEIVVKDRIGEFTVLFDDADAEVVLKHTWHIQHKKGRTSPKVKTVLWERGRCRSVFLHRLLMNPPSGSDIDHINGNGLDNRRVNLRCCSRAQNNANRHHMSLNKTSQYRGVYLDKSRNIWKAYISVGGKTRYLGWSRCEQTAAKFYNKAALGHFGEFAKLNTF